MFPMSEREECVYAAYLMWKLANGILYTGDRLTIRCYFTIYKKSIIDSSSQKFHNLHTIQIKGIVLE